MTIEAAERASEILKHLHSLEQEVNLWNKCYAVDSIVLRSGKEGYTVSGHIDFNAVKKIRMESIEKIIKEYREELNNLQ